MAMPCEATSECTPRARLGLRPAPPALLVPYGYGNYRSPGGAAAANVFSGAWSPTWCLSNAQDSFESTRGGAGLGPALESSAAPRRWRRDGPAKDNTALREGPHWLIPADPVPCRAVVPASLHRIGNTQCAGGHWGRCLHRRHRAQGAPLHSGSRRGVSWPGRHPSPSTSPGAGWGHPH